MDSKKILGKAREYRDYSAQNLSKIIRCPRSPRPKKTASSCSNSSVKRRVWKTSGSTASARSSGASAQAPGRSCSTRTTTPSVSATSPSGKPHPSRDSYRRPRPRRGASDQLGGAASMITAARILKDLAYKGDFEVWFSFTTIEEDCDGMCWKYLIEEEKFVPDFAVSTEPTSCRLYRGHRGAWRFRSTSRASPPRSAPERGDSAAYKAARAASPSRSSTNVSIPMTTTSSARAPSP